MSERIRVFGADKPVPGDLIFDTDASADEDAEMAIEGVDGDTTAADDKVVAEADPEETGTLSIP